jgi:hypothetical protein
VDIVPSVVPFAVSVIVPVGDLARLDVVMSTSILSLVFE